MAPEFSPEDILRILERHRVRYVVVGGYAATLHGSSQVTFDVDVTPKRDKENLRRLSDAMAELNARVWTNDEPDGLPFGHDAESLGRANIWNLVTDHGRFDITFKPAGTEGYEDLKRDAVRLNIFGIDVPVASLADVVRSKETAGREKDANALPVLRRLLEEGEPS
ncbi:MAG: hypothetical protein WD757_04245 [Actinomycetota bacterium]